jgi:hypothetical protein
VPSFRFFQRSQETPVQWPQAVTDLLDRITSTPSVDANSDEGRLNALSSALARLKDELRERIQATTAAEVTPLISLLEADGPIGGKELELIRLWLVGDAEYYVKTENDFSAWVAELDRLLGVLRQLRSEAVTPTTMARMEATVRDALRVASDIAFYRQQEDRVGSFQEATNQLNREGKRTLAQLLARKLSSEDV